MHSMRPRVMGFRPICSGAFWAKPHGQAAHGQLGGKKPSRPTCRAPVSNLPRWEGGGRRCRPSEASCLVIGLEGVRPDQAFWRVQLLWYIGSGRRATATIMESPSTTMTGRVGPWVGTAPRRSSSSTGTSDYPHTSCRVCGLMVRQACSAGSHI
jgi:hypothetical protein